MKRAQVWILGAALGSFAGGMSVGSAIPKALAGECATATPEYEDAHDLAVRYGLSAAQERCLRLVMQRDRDEEYAIFSNAQYTQLPPAMQSQLLAARNKTQQRIRAVLDEQQRERYDLDSRPEKHR